MEKLIDAVIFAGIFLLIGGAAGFTLGYFVTYWGVL